MTGNNSCGTAFTIHSSSITINVDSQAAVSTITGEMFANSWTEIKYRLDILWATNGAQMEVYWPCYCWTKLRAVENTETLDEPRGKVKLYIIL